MAAFAREVDVSGWSGSLEPKESAPAAGAAAHPLYPNLAWAWHAPALSWSAERPWLAISTAPLGGGIGERYWVINASVPPDYRRLDPDVHVTSIADEVGLHGTGTGMLTAVDVRNAVTRTDSGVLVNITTGIDHPVWAASAPPPPSRASSEPSVPRRRQGPPPSPHPPRPGTINAVCYSPVRLSEAALVNAVSTVAEAKAQAMLAARVPGTGTATDAIVLLCPTAGPAEYFGGPRSRMGAPLARAVYSAILVGLHARPPRFRV